MGNIRRYHLFNARVFMTAVCRGRMPYLGEPWAKELLLSVIRQVQSERPFAMLGYVVLNDHFHWLIRLIQESDEKIGAQVATPGKPGGAQRQLPDETPKHPRNRWQPGVDQDAAQGSYRTKDAGRRSAHGSESRLGNVKSHHTISDVMQSVKLRFTHRYKKVRGISTRLNVWQRRFWDHVVRDEKDLARHLDYIHFNPVKHGYVSDPSDYEWSSFATYQERGWYLPGWRCIEEPWSLSDMDLE